MIDPKGVIKAINAVISKGASMHYSALALKDQNRPQYNNGINQPIACKLGLSCCKDFYKSIETEKVIEKVCPLGFTVTKRVFDTATKYQRITIYNIVKYHPTTDAENYLTSLPRDLKEQKEPALRQLKGLELSEPSQRENKEFVEQLVETLLVGRIGLAIQSISHQFFTPLQGAMSDVKNIENKIDIDTSALRLSKNFDSLNKLATEVQLLLSTSDEFNKRMLRKVTVHPMVNEIFSSLKSTADEKNLVLHQGFNHYIKAVDAIPGQLNIHNAIKYSFNGIADNPLQVDVTYGSDDNFLVIYVKNQGCQITAEEISDRLIFNLGYRGKYSQDRQRRGSGTGLYISDEIVKSHGGQIRVTSRFIGGNKQSGTDRYENVFSIYWPDIII
jgi:signal transduction histidine kinase